MARRGIWTLAALLFSMNLFAGPADAQPAPTKVQQERAKAAAARTEPGPAVYPSSTANETAQFLAGLPPAPGSPFAPLTLDTAVDQHARHFNAEWAALEQRQLSKVRAFAAKNLTSPSKTLFYMFSGPDFLFADAFFPKASTYVLVGLEPVGPVPDIAKLPKGALPKMLGQLKTSLSHFVGKSYFVTSYMDQHLRQSVMPGTLPVLYVFLARAGKTITSVEHMRLAADGTVAPLGELAPGERPRAAKITFTGKDGAEQTLYYFNTDLSNKGVEASGFLTFLKTLGPGDSFIKAASYLLHGGPFSNVRDFLLEKSVAIFQDDTGIPVRNYNPAQWTLTPFGTYTRPIPTFARNYQKEMQTLFDQAKPAPLDFSISYRWRPGQSSAFLARRKM